MRIIKFLSAAVFLLGSVGYSPTLLAVPQCGATLTENTTLDGNMNCSGIALRLVGKPSRNVLLNCDGYSIDTTGGAIFVSGTKGVTIRNCVITATGRSAKGIELTNGARNSQVSNNDISVSGVYSSAIEINRDARDNKVTGNTLYTSGGSASLRIRFANDNTVSNNTIEADPSYAVAFVSAVKNKINGNTLVSPEGWVHHGRFGLQNGGLGVDSAGNIYAVENDWGSSAGLGTATASFMVDPLTGAASSVLPVLAGGRDVGFGFVALDLLPDGSLIALAGEADGGSSIFQIDAITREVSTTALNLPVLDGKPNGLQATSDTTLLATTNEGELLNIDLTTGNVTLIGEQATGWTDLATHPTSGKTYAVSRHRDEASATAHLYEIDVSDGQIVNPIGDTGQAEISSIDFAPDETLYGNTGQSGLVSLDIMTAATTVIGAFGPDPLEPLSRKNRLQNNRLQTADGSIAFVDSITLPSSPDADISSARVTISANSARVDSTELPFLDEPARIVLDNLDGDYRDLLIDPEDDGLFEACLSPQCKFVSFVGGALQFDVKGFTTYSSEKVKEPSYQYVVRVVRAEVDALLDGPGVSKGSKKKLQAARGELSDALKDIKKNRVNKSFPRISKAVSSLVKVEAKVAGADSLIERLAGGSRAEAQRAIDEAVAKRGDPAIIAEGEVEMAAAQILLGNDKANKAIKKYGKAWEAVQKAITAYDKAPGSRSAYSRYAFSGDGMVYRVDNDSGHLQPVRTNYDFASPFLALLPSGNTLYGRCLGSETICQGAVGADGRLTELLPRVSAGSNPVHAAIDPRGRYAYVANFDSDDLSQFRVEDDGRLTPLTPAAIAAGIDPLHIGIDPAGNYAYVVNQGSNDISRYRIGDDGSLSEKLPRIATGPGPRKLLIDALGKFLYVSVYDSQEIAQYRIGKQGALTELLPRVVTSEFSVGEPEDIVLDPLNQFVYATLRDGTERLYAIGDDGRLDEVLAPNIPGNGNLFVDPTGRFIYSVDNVVNDGHRSFYQFNIEHDGSLTPLMPSSTIRRANITELVFSGGDSLVQPVPVALYLGHSDGSVSQYTIEANGSLTEMAPATVAVSNSGVFGLAATASNSFLYATSLALGGINQVSQLAIAADGTLSALTPAHLVLGDDRPQGIAIDLSEEWIYSLAPLGDEAAEHRILGNAGTLIAAETPTSAMGDGPVDIEIHPNGKFAYVANQNDGTVSQFEMILAGTGVPGVRGNLEPVAAAIGADSLVSGVAVTPNGRFLYAVNPQKGVQGRFGNVSQYAIAADGSLSALTPAAVDVGAQTSSAAIAIHPAGLYAYVLNGYSDTITQFDIGADGGLHAAGTIAIAVDVPNAIAIDPSGRFLYVADGSASPELAMFAIDAVDGSLSALPGSPLVTHASSHTSIAITGSWR